MAVELVKPDPRRVTREDLSDTISQIKQGREPSGTAASQFIRKDLPPGVIAYLSPSEKFHRIVQPQALSAELVETAYKAKVDFYLIGGALLNSLMGVYRNTDLDLMTSPSNPKDSLDTPRQLVGRLSLKPTLEELKLENTERPVWVHTNKGEILLILTAREGRATNEPTRVRLALDPLKHLKKPSNPEALDWNDIACTVIADLTLVGRKFDYNIFKWSATRARLGSAFAYLRPTPWNHDFPFNVTIFDPYHEVEVADILKNRDERKDVPYELNDKNILYLNRHRSLTTLLDKTLTSTRFIKEASATVTKINDDLFVDAAKANARYATDCPPISEDQWDEVFHFLDKLYWIFDKTMKAESGLRTKPEHPGVVEILTSDVGKETFRRIGKLMKSKLGPAEGFILPTDKGETVEEYLRSIKRSDWDRQFTAFSRLFYFLQVQYLHYSLNSLGQCERNWELNLLPWETYSPKQQEYFLHLSERIDKVGGKRHRASIFKGLTLLLEPPDTRKKIIKHVGATNWPISTLLSVLAWRGIQSTMNIFVPLYPDGRLGKFGGKNAVQSDPVNITEMATYAALQVLK